jgi:hypothetical protein
MVSRRAFLIASSAMAGGLPSPAASATYPVRLGVDDASLARAGTPAQASRLFETLGQLGLKHIDIHLSPITNAGSQNSARMGERISQIDVLARQHGLTYTFNVEASNTRASAEITPGVNEYDHPGGLHRWDLRMEWLKPILPPAVPAPPAFQGIVYDECEHMVLSNHKYVSDGGQEYDRPFLVNTHGMAMGPAYDELVKACRRLREEHYEGRVPLSTEQVWPDLFHIFANAGWTVGPKILKESLSSVVMSIALGAALQYADRTHFWVSPDLWKLTEAGGAATPGHSPEALRSAWLMAYWLGAETIYIESLGNLVVRARPADAGKDELTPYGVVTREFAKQYVPSHPRPITWRDYRPRVAIVRLPDGGWGQSPPDASWEEYPSRDRLLGNREHPLDKAAAEWLYIWPILTHQAAHPGAITIFNRWVYPKKLDFFVPIDSVAVFDHLVEGPVLDSVECFVVCGHALSAQTFRAIQARVEKGATCIIAKRLYDRHASGPLPGDWLVFTSSVDPRIAGKLAPFLGPPNVARFRFARHVVEFEKGPNDDRIEVKVTERE